MGRLVGIRAASPLEASDLEFFRRQMLELPVVASTPLVLCADVRGLRVLPATLADELCAIMQRDNAWVVRSAFLLSPTSASQELQFDRLLHEAGIENRRLFIDPIKLAYWLNAVLTPGESAELSRFLSHPKLAA